jgi:4-methyl-5(b-hydroxyethyl)-thiazole monophosphate biosynthesis
MSKKVLVPLALGFEELEAVAIIDVLRRGGIEVIVAGVDKKSVSGANGIVIEADTLVSEVSAKNLDMVVLPGGWGGTDILAINENIQNILKEMKADDKKIGAICAAPFALSEAGVLGENFTCYPSVEERIEKNSGYSSEKMVVRDGNVMTSRGPGTAICFGLQIVRDLIDEETYKNLKDGLLATYCED